MNPLAQGPLTDDEIEELERFLLDAPDLEESMDISTLDGFLTAVVCGPRMILPSEWMRWVWDLERGEDSPAFESEAQAGRIVGLLMRHMNGVAATLDEAPEEYEPLVLENPNDGDPVPVIDEWCTGFMKGVQLDAEGWAPLLAGKPECLSTVVLYGTEEGWEALKKRDLPLDEHRVLAGGAGPGEGRVADSREDSGRHRGPRETHAGRRVAARSSADAGGPAMHERPG